MFIPVGSFMQYIEQIDKDAEGNIHTKKVMGVRVSFLWCFVVKRPIADIPPTVCSIDGQRGTSGRLNDNSSLPVSYLYSSRVTLLACQCTVLVVLSFGYNGFQPLPMHGCCEAIMPRFQNSMPWLELGLGPSAMF